MNPEITELSQTAYQLDARGLLPDTLPLYPEGNQYAVDPTCGSIVRELQRLHWRASGVSTVDFWMSEGADPKPISVYRIEGTTFQLTFARGFRSSLDPVTHSLSHTFTNISRIDIPHRQLEMFDDFSGPGYRVYQGIAWPRDRAAFEHQNRFSFAYTGSDDRHRNVRHVDNSGQMDRVATYLIPNTHANYGVIRWPWLPAVLVTEDVISQTDGWLQANVLTRLQDIPTP